MRVKLFVTVAALLPLLTAAPALSADMSPAGLWQAVDEDTKQPTGWFLITDHNGAFDGIIAKMFLKPGENPNTVCDQCTDDRRGHAWLGLEIIRGMKQESDDKYASGTILDPRDGKIYKATMKVSPDGQTLIVRGYLGLQLQRLNNKRLKIGDLKSDDGTITADIVTVDNSLVQRLKIDRHTGVIQYEN